MKLISLKFKAFAAYLDEQYINFESFSDKGLFLISGKTGSGKTAILDAITYALYGKSSGGNRGDIYAMRCHFAKANDNTEVELIFEVRGKRYKFIRRLEQKRVNIASTYNAFYMGDEGIFIPFFENPHLRDIEQKATELIGLNYEQFRQVILLPQGQFEKLLVAKSEDKEKILVNLFGAEKWQKAAERYFELVNAKKRQLDASKEQINNILESYGCDSVEELKQLLKEKRTEYKKVKEQEKVLSEDNKALNSEAEKLFVTAEKFRSIENLLIKEEKLKQSAEIMELLSQQIEKYESALKIKKIYDKKTEAFALKIQRENELKEKQKLHCDTEKLLNITKEKLENLKSQDDEMSAKKNKISEMESLRNVFSNLDSLKKILFEKESLFKENSKKIAILEQTVEKLSNKSELSEKEVLEKYTEYNALLTEYLNGMSGSLAKELKDNVPCPVCGSKNHPNPAKICDVSVDQAMLDSKSIELEDTKKARDQIKSDFFSAERELKEAKEVLNEELLEIKKDSAVIENIKTGIDTNIKDLNELEEIISSLSGEFRKYEDEVVYAENKYSSYKLQHASERAMIEFVENEHKLASTEYGKADVAFKEALLKNGFASEQEYINSLLEEDEFQNISKRLNDYKVEKSHLIMRLNELRTELDGVEEPDIVSVKNELKELENKLLDARGRSTVLFSEIQNLEATHTELRKKFKAYIQEDEQNQKDFIFAKRMRGDTGIGIQRYLLGVVLTQITKEANRLLENVHCGRYRLLRTLESSGLSRKTGLELEVYDSFTGERRGVETLSGGEKFLVALSLSIGLSTVVQSESAGINIETMFVDEGFGSLDPASINDALNVLGKFKNNGSIIGIISHVDELKDNIDSRIEVIKERSGSKLLVCI